MSSLKRIILLSFAGILPFAFTSCGSSKPARQSSYRPAPRIVYKPLVKIRNRSNKSILLGLRGPENRFVNIPAWSSRSINLRSGAYKYAATARGTKVKSGYKYFGTNKKYTWNFSIN